MATILAASGDGVTVTGEQLSYVASALIGGAAVALGLWFRHGKMLRRVLSEWEVMLSDWNGVPDRPGVHGRPGVMVRMASIEGQLVENGGSSLRDALKRVEKGQQATAARVEDIVVELARKPALVQLAAGDGILVGPAIGVEPPRSLTD